MADIEVSTHVNATPTQVWELIGDPTRMGEWSPECVRVEWVSGATGPAVGAKFKGHNRNGRRRWTTGGKIVSLEPEKEIAWDVNVGPFAVARWGYRLEAAEDGCTIAETFADHRNAATKLVSRPIRGVSDVDADNRQGMHETLGRIKAVAEGPQL